MTIYGTILSQAALFAAVVLGAPSVATAQADDSVRTIRPAMPAIVVASEVPNRRSIDESGFPLTILTMAPDGSWGVATNRAINRAIAAAIANCRKKYQKDIGCGSRFTIVRGGWSLAMRCGSENILVAAKLLADAVKTAVERERTLRLNYVRDMPACRHVLTVNPRGVVFHLGAQSSRRAPAWESTAAMLPAMPKSIDPTRSSALNAENVFSN